MDHSIMVCDICLVSLSRVYRGSLATPTKPNWQILERLVFLSECDIVEVQNADDPQYLPKYLTDGVQIDAMSGGMSNLCDSAFG